MTGQVLIPGPVITATKDDLRCYVPVSSIEYVYKCGEHDQWGIVTATSVFVISFEQARLLLGERVIYNGHGRD